MTLLREPIRIQPFLDIDRETQELTAICSEFRTNQGESVSTDPGSESIEPASCVGQMAQRGYVGALTDS